LRVVAVTRGGVPAPGLRLSRIDGCGSRIICCVTALLSAAKRKSDVTPFLQRCRALCAALVMLMPTIAAAAAPAPAQLTAQDTLELQRIAAYLNGIHTMTAGFRQIANNGAVSQGKLWVARPGRMRFEYAPPNPITLLADSTNVYYWDKELNQVSKYELRSTPAWFLLRDPISFGADVVVIGFEHIGGAVGVTVSESAQPDAGTLTLMFTENPLTLRQWIVVDQQGKTTSVTLSDLQFGMALDPKLFQYQYLFSGSNR
jgi:outer membrane lipoprotein-sorting protein